MELKSINIDNKAISSLKSILNSLKNIKSLDLNELEQDETVLIHIDIVNGFLFEGPLSSDIVAKILPSVVELNMRMSDYNKLFVLDTHTSNSKEFDAYPPHCITGTPECELVNNLIPFSNEKNVVRKNSTNLWHSNEFKAWFKDNSELKNYVIVGDVSDICVLQAALSLKTYFFEHNRDARIIVLTDCIDTFHLDAINHNSSLMNIFALYNMQMNGVELYSNIY